jgi:hypothetical protein
VLRDLGVLRRGLFGVMLRTQDCLERVLQIWLNRPEHWLESPVWERHCLQDVAIIDFDRILWMRCRCGWKLTEHCFPEKGMHPVSLPKSLSAPAVQAANPKKQRAVRAISGKDRLPNGVCGVD